MPKKTNKVEVGSLWQDKDPRNKNIYIITEIVKHPWNEGSVNFKRVDMMDDGVHNVSLLHFTEDYRKIS